MIKKKPIIIFFVILIAVILFRKEIFTNDIKLYDIKFEDKPIYVEDESSENVYEEEDDLDSVEFHLSIMTTDDGYNIYSPTSMGYRYGPSIIYYDDGSIDAYFARQGSTTEWDWISYKHYDGEKWSLEKVVLSPNANSNDHYSTCDPGVIFFNDYYYIGYTSTLNPKGNDNCIYVARSENPDGPFEKWNGKGWGGDPYPIIEYEGQPGFWGTGEISFVVCKDKLYCYYTYISEEGEYTKVSTADLCEDWPDTLEFIDNCYVRSNAQDSCDVAYLEEFDMFIAVSSVNRFTKNSGISVLESFDGIHFEESDIVRKGISQYCHNVGISKRSDGHIKIGDEIFIGYAYGNSKSCWGRWSTRFQGIKVYFYQGRISYPSKNNSSTYRDLREG